MKVTEYILAGFIGIILGTGLGFELMDVDLFTWIGEAIAYYN